MSIPAIIRDRHAILVWLSVCLQLVALMVLIGGYTRLSDSGLSITSWKPIHGVIPPLNVEEWQEEFEAYKETAQYRKIFFDMSLSGFKAIFWPEYVHRLMGRIVGLAFFIPLVVFAYRRSLQGRFLWRMCGIFALGALQGAVGWIMVASGLGDLPYVSHIRLTLHLALAFIIFALILQAILDILNDKKPREKITVRRPHLFAYRLWFALLCVQIILGGFMAGLHAGLVYNTWPTMNGEFIPSELFHHDSSLTENIALVQFLHRIIAVIVFLGFLLWCYMYHGYINICSLTGGCVILGAVIFMQFTLGVLTLIYSVPLPVALAHQMCALALWAIAVWLLYRLVHCNTVLKEISEIDYEV